MHSRLGFSLINHPFWGTRHDSRAFLPAQDEQLKKGRSNGGLQTAAKYVRTHQRPAVMNIPHENHVTQNEQLHQKAMVSEILDGFRMGNGFIFPYIRFDDCWMLSP